MTFHLISSLLHILHDTSLKWEDTCNTQCIMSSKKVQVLFHTLGLCHGKGRETEQNFQIKLFTENINFHQNENTLDEKMITVARTVGNQMYMKFKYKQGTFFGPVQEYRPYEKHVTQFKGNTLDVAILNTSKHLTQGFLDLSNFECSLVEKNEQ